jgi:hypothetical protein
MLYLEKINMKKAIIFCSSLLLIASCRKQVTCTCKDHKGAVIKSDQQTGKEFENEIFKSECEKTKTRSYNDTGLVMYTPCEFQ